MVALGITVSEPSTMTFVDVNKNSDLAKYIEAAKFLNILSGQMKNGQHIFRPNDSITRSEIAKVVANAFGL
jgi:S-layer homology domain